MENKTNMVLHRRQPENSTLPSQTSLQLCSLSSMLSWLSIFRVRSLPSDLSLRLTSNSFSFKCILNFPSKMRHPTKLVGLVQHLHLIHRGIVLQLLEPSTSVLPDIKVDRHYHWHDSGEKGNRPSNILLTTPLCYLLQPRMVQDLCLVFLMLPPLPMTCSPLPKCVCYHPSCVSHWRAALVSHLWLWTQGAGGACAGGASL